MYYLKNRCVLFIHVTCIADGTMRRWGCRPKNSTVSSCHDISVSFKSGENKENAPKKTPIETSKKRRECVCVCALATHLCVWEETPRCLLIILECFVIAFLLTFFFLSMKAHLLRQLLDVSSA